MVTMSIVKRLWDLKSNLQRMVFGGPQHAARPEPWAPAQPAGPARVPPLVTPAPHPQPLAVPVPVLDQAKCNACGECAAICATDAIVVEQTATIDEEKCVGCGACVALCPEQALSMDPDR
jgi:Pyruvate/2-oxoacid:ferredoxin oxidoreductase delta subunit